MKKVFYLFTAAMLCMCSLHLHGQISIGKSEKPKAGTLIDLSSETKGTLLLPNVNLTDLEIIPAGLVGITTGQATNPALRGSIVYNTNPATGAGVYVWDGNRWNMILTSAEACQQITKPKATVDKNTVSTGELFRLTATVGGNPEHVQQWYMKRASSSNWEIVSSATGLTLNRSESESGEYRYYCAVAPACSPCSEQRSDTVTVTVTGTGGPCVASIEIEDNTPGQSHTITAGTSVTFRIKSTTNAGIESTYVWTSNSNIVSTEETYTTNTLTNGQEITCHMWPKAPCLGNFSPVSSNTIKIKVQ